MPGVFPAGTILVEFLRCRNELAMTTAGPTPPLSITAATPSVSWQAASLLLGTGLVGSSLALLASRMKRMNATIGEIDKSTHGLLQIPNAHTICMEGLSDIFILLFFPFHVCSHVRLDHGEMTG
jgi:hypothetical protein